MASPFGSEQIGPHRINLFHAVENQSSCGVARAAGFAREGTSRQSFGHAEGMQHDEHLHALLGTDACE